MLLTLQHQGFRVLLSIFWVRSATESQGGKLESPHSASEHQSAAGLNQQVFDNTVQKGLSFAMAVYSVTYFPLRK